MKLAFAVFNYPPDVFWSMTLKEWLLAIEGYNELQRDGDEEPLEPFSQEELEELMARYPDEV